MAKYTKDGREEVPDPTPVELPVALRRVVDLRDEMMAFVRDHMSRLAEEQGDESFEESEDFDVDDDPAPMSPHEQADLEDRLDPGQWRRMIAERVRAERASSGEEPGKRGLDRGDDKAGKDGADVRGGKPGIDDGDVPASAGKSEVGSREGGSGGGRKAGS